MYTKFLNLVLCLLLVACNEISPVKRNSPSSTPSASQGDDSDQNATDRPGAPSVGDRDVGNRDSETPVVVKLTDFELNQALPNLRVGDSFQTNLLGIFSNGSRRFLTGVTVDIAEGKDVLDVDFKGDVLTLKAKKFGVVSIKLSHPDLSPKTFSLNVDHPAATQIEAEFSSLTARKCEPLALKFKDSAGNFAVLAKVDNLQIKSQADKIFTDAACTLLASAQSQKIQVGQSQVSLFTKSNDLGFFSFDFAVGNLSSSKMLEFKNEVVSQLELTGIGDFIAGSCQRFDVVLKDELGNNAPVEADSANLVLSLGQASGDITIYRGDGCISGNIGSLKNAEDTVAIRIDRYQHSSLFWISSTLAHQTSLRLKLSTAPTLDASKNLTVNADVPYGIYQLKNSLKAFSTAYQANSCTDAVEVSIADRFGNSVSDRAQSLSFSGSNILFSDSTCATQTNVVNFAIGEAKKTVYLKGSTVGNHSITMNSRTSQIAIIGPPTALKITDVDPSASPYAGRYKLYMVSLINANGDETLDLIAHDISITSPQNPSLNIVASIGAKATAAMFSFMPAVDGQNDFTASTPGLSSATRSIVANTPHDVLVTFGPSSLPSVSAPQGYCLGPIKVAIVLANGNYSYPATSLAVTLGDLNVQSFHSNAQCSSRVTETVIAAGNYLSNPVYIKTYDPSLYTPGYSVGFGPFSIYVQPTLRAFHTVSVQ